MVSRAENNLTELRSEGQGAECPTAAAGRWTIGREAKPSYSQPMKTLSFERVEKRAPNKRQPVCADGVGPDNLEHTGMEDQILSLSLSALPSWVEQEAETRPTRLLWYPWTIPN